MISGIGSTDSTFLFAVRRTWWGCAAWLVLLFSALVERLKPQLCVETYKVDGRTRRNRVAFFLADKNNQRVIAEQERKLRRSSFIIFQDLPRHLLNDLSLISGINRSNCDFQPFDGWEGRSKQLRFPTLMDRKEQGEGARLPTNRIVGIWSIHPLPDIVCLMKISTKKEPIKQRKSNGFCLLSEPPSPSPHIKGKTLQRAHPVMMWWWMMMMVVGVGEQRGLGGRSHSCPCGSGNRHILSPREGSSRLLPSPLLLLQNCW